MLFDDDGSYLINFDFTNPVNMPYPIGYNPKIDCRHKDAREFKKMKIEHDRYALAMILISKMMT